MGREHRRTRTLASLVLAVVLTACTLTTSLTGYSGGAEESDAATPESPPPEAGSAEGSTSPPVEVVSLAQVGGVPRATGLPMQGHLVWAEKSARWVLFTFDASIPTSLRTRVSSDFRAWTDGASVDLPSAHSNEGRNLAVGAATLGSVDVFHVTVSLRTNNSDRRIYWARATMSGGALAFVPPTLLSSSDEADPTLDPDGAAIGIAKNGSVTVFTGWSMGTDPTSTTSGTGNEYAFRSNAPDVGNGSFVPTWDKSYVKVVNKSATRGAPSRSGRATCSPSSRRATQIRSRRT